MTYEPKGSVKAGLDALDKEPHRIWSSKELAETLQVPQSSISACFESAVRHGRVYRRMGTGGQLQWRRDPFDDTAQAPIDIPRVGGGFVPAPMPVPRAGSDVRHENPRPPKLCAGCSKAQCWDNGCQDAVADAAAVASVAPAPAPTPAPTSAPAPSTAATPEIDPRFATAHYGHDLRPGDGLVWVQVQDDEAANAVGAGEVEQVDEEEDEAVEPDAFYSCRSGEIILVGLEPDEEGRITIPAELVTLIKRQITWSPGR